MVKRMKNEHGVRKSDIMHGTVVKTADEKIGTVHNVDQREDSIEISTKDGMIYKSWHDIAEIDPER